MTWLVLLIGWLKKIPWQLWLTGVFLLVCFFCYRAGQKNVRTEWEASIARGTAVVNELKKNQSVATVKFVTHFKGTARIIHEKGDTIIKRIPEYIPAESCDLPGGFRLLYDSSVSGEPLPESPVGIESQPIPLRQASVTIFRNNTTCLTSSAAYQTLWDLWLEYKRLADIAAKELQKQR